MSVLARLLGYGKVEALQRTKNRPRLISSILCWIVGAVFAYAMISNGLETNEDLLEVGVPTKAVDSWSGKRGRILPIIEVDGKQYLCGGRGLSLDIRKDTILYDPNNPDNCHEKDNIGEREYFLVIVGVVSGLFMLGLGLMLFLEPQPKR